MSKNLCLLNVCWWCDLLLWAVFLSSYYKYNFTLNSNLQSSDFYQLEIIYTVWDKIPNTDEQNLYSRSHAGELSQFYVLWYSESIKLSSCSNSILVPLPETQRGPTSSVGFCVLKTSLDMFIANREFFPLLKRIEEDIFTGGLILIESPWTSNLFAS